nr:cysteine--tRNA ligase [Candidatus Sulfurimonas ponti]
FQFGIDNATKETLDSLISKRDEAKKDKDFELSDKLRDEILDFGVSLMDTPAGTFWEKL